MTAFSSKTVAASALLDSAQNPTTAAYFSRSADLGERRRA